MEFCIPGRTLTKNTFCVEDTVNDFFKGNQYLLQFLHENCFTAKTTANNLRQGFVLTDGSQLNIYLDAITSLVMSNNNSYIKLF